MKRLFITMALTVVGLFLLGLLVPQGAGAEPDEGWVAYYNGPGNLSDSANAIAEDPSTGNVYVTGPSYGSATSYDYATAAYDSGGNELWAARYNGLANGADTSYAIAVDPEKGNVYITGDSYGSGTSNDIVTVAYDAGGNELWAARYNGPGNSFDQAFEVAVDPATGNVYVTGQIFETGTTFDIDFITLAYDAGGNELWAAIYDGPGNSYDSAVDLAVDPETGNVYVTGQSIETGSAYNFTYTTVAYDKAGNELWAASYNGPGSNYDKPSAVAVDPETGNVYVTGESYGTSMVSDFATVAYGSGGNEMWVARYNGPGNSYDSAVDLAVDQSTGNIYVTGTSYGSGTMNDMATVAYDSAGNELWAASYNGPANGNDSASAIAVSSSTGNVYVAGTVYGSATVNDIATVAYDMAGNELGSASYNGPANSSDYACAIAVDTSAGGLYVAGATITSGWYTDFVTIKYGISTAGTGEGEDPTEEPEYQFGGFLAPLKPAPLVNKAKAGRTIPVKFQLFDSDGFNITDTAAVTGVWYQACLGDEMSEAETSGKSGLRYDKHKKQFVLKWKTPKGIKGCYSLVVEILGSGQHQANFKFK